MAVNSGDKRRVSHGEDWSHRVQRGDQDAAFTDTGCQQEGPCGFSVSLSVAEDLEDDTEEHTNTTAA